VYANDWISGGDMAALALGATIVAVLLWKEAARETLYRLLGISSGRGTDHHTKVKVLGMLLLLALMIALDPEVRVFLLFVDTVSVELFLLLLAFQAREYLWPLYGAVIRPAARHLGDAGPYPLPLPSRRFFAQHPFWAAFAAVQLVAVGSRFALLGALVIIAATSILTWPTAKALSATVLARPHRVAANIPEMRRRLASLL
jgi:hypothetical protein